MRSAKASVTGTGGGQILVDLEPERHRSRLGWRGTKFTKTIAAASPAEVAAPLASSAWP